VFETERLVVRPPEPDELQALLEVYASNPGYLALTEGSAGEPGRYDLGMLERDVTLAGLTPGRTLAGLFLRASGELAGVVDWMDENPEDRMPWIGLLMIRADRQHQGLATEAFDASPGSGSRGRTQCAPRCSRATRQDARLPNGSGSGRSRHEPGGLRAGGARRPRARAPGLTRG
jgi:hypothetical protein